jgi:hypothetical protein
MEVYVLDEELRRIKVVDSFSSLIWADRMTDISDFEIDIFSTDKARNILPIGAKLAVNGSYRVMTIETIEDTTDDQGISLLKLKGRSLEKTLGNRLALAALADTTTTPKWVLTGLPADLARQIFHDICVTGTIDAGDIIPDIIEGTFLPTSLIPEPTDSITYEIEPTSVFSALKTLCDQYFMGFRIIRDPSTADLYFEVFMGNDRTSSQTDFPAVIFNPNVGNLSNTSEITSTALSKNVAYVISPVGAEIVYALDVDPSVNGFERDVLLVNATDITETDPPTATALMIQRGLQELSKNRVVSAFDGELSTSSGYVVNKDFYLGDLVELRSRTGSKDVMQVTELIHISDKNGERHYPTLTIYNFITPGTWDSRPVADEWDTVDDAEHWDDLT